MRTALYGRTVFGAAALLLGVITLIWRDPDTWQSLPILKLGAVVGTCFAIAQIAGGIGMLVPRTARLAAVVLGVVYGLFCVACIPGMIARPTTYAQYGSFFEWFSLVCGAIAVYAVTEANAARSASLGNAARIGIGLCAVSFTLAQIVYLRFTASLVPTWIPPSQMFWTVLTTVAFALAAIAILINRQVRLALQLMTLMIGLFGVFVWIPLLVAHPEAHGNWSEFALNFLIAGAAWLVANVRPVGITVQAAGN
jgi:hypothetical protein